MLMNIKHAVSVFGFQYVKPHQRSRALLHNHPRKKIIFSSKEKQEFPQLISNYTGLHMYGNNTRKYMVHGVEPGASPSGLPPNVISWIVAAAIAIVVPSISYKWGPLLKKKIEAALQTTEDVAEAVEKVAEMVEKVAEDIADDLPDGGKLRKAVDFVEKYAERAAKDAGAIDDFIDKVQEEEEKAKSIVESAREAESRKPPPNDTNEVQEEGENAKSTVEFVRKAESKKSPPNDTNEVKAK